MVQHDHRTRGDVFPEPPHHTNVAARRNKLPIRKQESLIAPESFRQSAERFGWSASVWLSKQLNGRTPALMAPVTLPRRLNDRRLNELLNDRLDDRLNDRRFAERISRARQCDRFQITSSK